MEVGSYQKFGKTYFPKDTHNYGKAYYKALA